MFLESTPYITIRKANGLYNIDYTACDILFDKINDNAAARSYNTIIGIYTKDSTGNKIYLETAGVYSQTTCSKHKPRAAAIASHNGYKIVSNIKPEVLHNLYFYNKYNVDDIIKESEERRQILKALYNNDNTAPAILDAKYKSVITARKKPDHKTYKNGNYLNKYYCQAVFKYLSAIYYETNIKHIVVKHKGYYGPNGYKPAFKTNTIKTNIVNIDY